MKPRAAPRCVAGRDEAHPAPRRRVLQALGLAACVGSGSLGAWGTARAASAAEPLPTSPPEPVAWPAVRLLDGSLLDPGHWRDRAAVVVFWSTTCPFCRRHNQHVEKLHRAAQAQPATAAALSVLGVARERDADVVRRHAQAQGYSFPITLDTAPLAAVLSPRRVIPLTVAVRRDGRVHQVLPGEMFEEDVMELLRLAAPTPRAHRP